MRKLLLQPKNLKNSILGQGVSNLMGAKFSLEPKAGAKPLPEDLMALLLTASESTWALNYILNVSPAVKNWVKQSQIDTMEKNRHELWKIKDKKRRYQTFMGQSILDMILPELGQILIDWDLPKDLIIHKGMTLAEMDSFLESVPTALCLFNVIYYRDQKRERKIQANDFNDIWFLSSAIPYSDIVVTERLWKTISKVSKLDLKCNTKVFSSIYDLIPFL